MVATPIGNLADLTLRALHVLGRVDVVACEDTRVSGALLRRLGVQRPLLSLHEHNEAAAAAEVVRRLQRGERVACISDAGTPAISDPGARLVAAVQAAGLGVMPLPGASSVVTAMSVAGDVQAVGFRFEGFLPTQAAARRERLQLLAHERASVVLFEAPHRIEALARALAEGLPQHRLTVCRELTKQFEQIVTLGCVSFPDWLAADADHRRGEFVLVLHAAPAGSAAQAAPQAALGASTERLLAVLLDELPLKQAVALAARATGQPRNAVYEQALRLRDAGAPGDESAGADTAPADHRPAADWPADPRRVPRGGTVPPPANRRRR